MRSFWYNLPIRIKILSYYMAVVILLSITLTVFNNNNTKILNLLNENITNNYKVYVVMEKTSQNFKDIENYIVYDDQDALESYMNRNEIVELMVEELYNIQTSLESYFTINAIYYSTIAYNRKFLNAANLKQNGDELYYDEYFKGQSIFKYTNRYFDDLLLINLREEATRVEAVKNETERIKNISYAFLIAFGLLTLILGILLSNYIVLPIKKLSKYSKQISEGNLDVKEVNVISDDEIGNLSRAYNHMVHSIKNYVARIKEKANVEKKLHEEERAVMQMERLLQQAKLDALQAKINPHFLFNTLNVISRTAFFEEANETMDLIQMLSNIFRYQLKSAGELVPLAEEKILITDYLKLQSVRFKERLEYEIDIPVNINVEIPVLMLQPLVENSITHGFGSKVEGGKIIIKAYKKDESIIIEVSDNGIGMDENLINKITSSQELSIKNRPSIGIRNVRDRFLLAYPNRSKFILRSKKNVGTTVQMIISKGKK